MRDQLLAIGWMVALYVGTALMVGKDPRPPGGLALIVFEARHIAMHLVAYAVQTWLLARAGGSVKWRISVLLGKAVLIGMGQELLQNALRRLVLFWPSMFDLGVDTVGALLGLGLYRLWETGRQHTSKVSQHRAR